MPDEVKKFVLVQPGTSLARVFAVLMAKGEIETAAAVLIGNVTLHPSNFCPPGTIFVVDPSVCPLPPLSGAPMFAKQVP